MNFRILLHALGGLLIFLALMLLTPVPVSLIYRDGQSLVFVVSAAVTAVVGGVLYYRFRGRREITLREGFAIVTFAWLGYAVFGSLPFVLSGSLPSPVDAFFESMSGFTTCGASVMVDVEGNARSVLFWRALTQWIGGMGFIVLGIAVLPLLGVGGMQLYEAEVAGPTSDRLTPRIQDTARLLWGTYAIATAAGVALLWLGEMDLFDAVCHSFTAVSTAGFSTRNASVGAFGTYSQMVITLLMLVGGMSYSLHYFAMRGKFRKYWESGEWRWFMGFLGLIILVVVAANARSYDSQLLNIRDSVFTCVSVLTTTGFATADYNGWPMVAQLLLMFAVFVGACAGSTAGGIKQVRLILLFKHSLLQARQLVHPRQVTVLKFDGRPVSPDIMRDVLGLTVLFVGTFLVGSLLLAAVGMDLVSATSATMACLTTLGPGLGEVGPVGNYAAVPATGKFVLSLIMLIGRLEVWTVLVLFFVSFWRK